MRLEKNKDIQRDRFPRQPSLSYGHHLPSSLTLLRSFERATLFQQRFNFANHSGVTIDLSLIELCVNAEPFFTLTESLTSELKHHAFYQLIVKVFLRRTMHIFQRQLFNSFPFLLLLPSLRFIIDLPLSRFPLGSSLESIFL